jgi:hypothetical protein
MIALVLAALISGTFALQHGAPKTTSHLAMTQVGTSPLDERLDFWLTDSHANVVTRYRIDMTKYLHLIIVSDDFRSFAHIHPKLDAAGHFHIDHQFPQPGLYHAYADSDPAPLGQQVFRYDLTVGTAAPHRVPKLARSETSAAVDGYRVTLGTTRLHPGDVTQIPVHITKGGRPATDLHPYLGALAHAVFLDAEDLSYTHVHPMELDAGAMSTGTTGGMSGMDMQGMDMPGMDMPALPDSARSASAMRLDVRVLRPGLYKLWLQFRGGTQLHVATFVLIA